MRRRLVALLVAGAALLLTACRVDAVVDVQVEADGSGVVTAAIGLDAGARARLDASGGGLAVDDLTAAGWTVTGPETDASGTTWWRASKPFTDAAGLDATVTELTGPDGAFQDFALTATETETDTTHRLTGTIDLGRGLEQFSDPELAASLDGEPFGGLLERIEAEEGRPAGEMVSVEVGVQVAGGERQVYRPTLAASTPVAVDVSQVVAKPPPPQSLAVYGLLVVLGVGIVALMLVRVRRRFALPPVPPEDRARPNVDDWIDLER